MIPAQEFGHRLQSEIPHLRRYARSLTRSADTADDLMQTALEQALRSEAQFAPGTAMRRWLFTILRNAHFDEQRKTVRRGQHVPIEEWHRETHMGPAQERRLELEDVTKSIEHLRQEERNVLQLSVFGGLSHDQVASELGIAVGTVKSRLSRARQSLAA